MYFCANIFFRQRILLLSSIDRSLPDRSGDSCLETMTVVSNNDWYLTSITEVIVILK